MAGRILPLETLHPAADHALRCASILQYAERASDRASQTDNGSRTLSQFPVHHFLIAAGASRRSSAQMVFSDLMFNALVEWLSPAEYDGRALVTLPESDPRLQCVALMRWEVGNALLTLRSVSHKLSPFRTFFSTVAARDLIGRLVQYTLRLVAGSLRVAFPHQESTQRLAQALGRIASAISDSRRTYRLLELGPTVSLMQAPLGTEGRALRLTTPEEWMTLTSRWAMFTFSFLDRWRWLQDRRILVREHAPRVAQGCFIALTISHVCVALKLLLRARSLSASLHEVHANGEEQGQGEMRRCFRDLLHRLLCILQTAHIAKLPMLQSNDVLVAGMGVLTTARDVNTLWAKSQCR